MVLSDSSASSSRTWTLRCRPSAWVPAWAPAPASSLYVLTCASSFSTSPSRTEFLCDSDVISCSFCVVSASSCLTLALSSSARAALSSASIRRASIRCALLVSVLPSENMGGEAASFSLGVYGGVCLGAPPARHGGVVGDAHLLDLVHGCGGCVRLLLWCVVREQRWQMAVWRVICATAAGDFVWTKALGGAARRRRWPKGRCSPLPHSAALVPARPCSSPSPLPQRPSP